jgi:hypothetical protein
MPMGSTPAQARCTTLCDKVCQWLAAGRWFSLGPPVSSTNKTDRNDITEILLKVALNTINQKPLQRGPDTSYNNLYIGHFHAFLIFIIPRRYYNTFMIIHINISLKCVFRYLKSLMRKQKNDLCKPKITHVSKPSY